MPRSGPQARRSRDDGLGLVELVIGMLLLTIVALSFGALMITSYAAASRSANLSSATAAVGRQLELAREVTPATCAALTAFAGGTEQTVTGAGRTVHLRRAIVGSCTAGGTVTVRAWATVGSSSTVVAEARTRIWVPS